MRLGRRIDAVDVSIGIPPLAISGSFRPSKAEQLGAWELLVELTSRTAVAPLAPDVGLLREALSSHYALFQITRDILRKHGPEVADSRHDGNLSLGVMAMRVLNEVLRPTLSRWHPALADYENGRPQGVSQLEWERRWARDKECRTALNDVRAAVRSYIDALGRIAGAPDLADAAVAVPPSRPAPLERRAGEPSKATPEPIGAVPQWPRPDGSPKKRMVGWFDLVEGLRTMKAIRIGKRDDKARADSTAPERLVTLDLSATTGDVWVDYVADLGDAFDATMAVAWFLTRKHLHVPSDENAEFPAVPSGGLPRGELLIMGGDEVYPYASGDKYEQQTVLPYVCARDDGTVGRVLALPGNHDYYGGIKHFEERFVGDGAEVAGTGLGSGPGSWASAGQDRRWFSTKLPHGWWIWGLDTGLDGSIDKGQREHFRHLVASDQFGLGDRVVLCTPVPLWQLRQKHEGQYQDLRQHIDGWLEPKRGTVALFVAGDSHYFAQYDDTSRDEHHLTVGGGGAFLHPTHSLAERVPSERGRPEFRLNARWPSPVDSRALAPRFTMLRNRQFLALGLIFAGVFGLGAWVVSTRWLRLPWGAEAARPWPLGALSHVARVGALWPVLLVLAVAGAFLTTPNAREHMLRQGAHRYGLAFGGALGSVLFVALVHAFWLIDTVIRPSWGRFWWFGGASLLAGVILLATFFRGVAWLCVRLRVNDNLAFSAVASPRFKHFVRFRFDCDGRLTVYVVGIDPIGRGWWDAMGKDRVLPPSDPAGVAHLHYVWGTTIPVRSAPGDPGTALRLVAISVSTTGDDEPTASQALEIVVRVVIGGLLADDISVAYGGWPGPNGATETDFRSVLADAATVATACGTGPNGPDGTGADGSGAHGPGADGPGPTRPTAGVVSYLAAPLWSRKGPSMSPDGSEIRCDALPSGCKVLPHPLDARALAFTSMRERMAADCTARVIVGGRLNDYAGRYPGVIEEAITTIAAGGALYIVGGFGGAAAALARHVRGETVPELSNIWQRAHTPAVAARGTRLADTTYRIDLEADLTAALPRGHWSSLRNGLSVEQNERLAVAADPSEIVALIRRGIDQLFTRRPQR